MKEKNDNLERDLKLYKVIMHMLTQTDEEHPQSLTEIVSDFETEYPSMTNKFVSKCIRLMSAQGFPIREIKEGHTILFYSATSFSFWVYQTLFILIESAKFLSRETSDKLVQSICAIAPKGTESRLNRISFYRNMAKTTNNETAHSISVISSALLNNRKVSFFFQRPEQESDDSTQRKEITADPIALIPDSDKLYFVCIPDYIHSKGGQNDITRKFRIENICGLKEKKESTCSLALKMRDSVTEDYNGMFRMFSGKACNELVLQFPSRFLRSVYDYFGENINLKKFESVESDIFYQATVSAQISKYFFWWVLESGGRIKIISPEWVLERLYEHLHENHLRFDDTGSDGNISHNIKTQSEAATSDCRETEQK